VKRPGVRAVVARCISIRTEDLWEMLELRSLKVGKEGKGGVLEGGTPGWGSVGTYGEEADVSWGSIYRVNSSGRF
jgi:hypothetical protein